MSYNSSNISKFLKEMRNLMMFKQTEVAEAVGVSVQSYIKYEKGLREPSVEVLYKLSKFYKVSPILFFVSDYPLDKEEKNDKLFMNLSIISANFERYQWLIKRYMEKLSIDIDFETGYIKKDEKTMLKIKSSLYRIFGELAILKRDLLKEVEEIDENTKVLLEKADRL